MVHPHAFSVFVCMCGYLIAQNINATYGVPRLAKAKSYPSHLFVMTAQSLMEAYPKNTFCHKDLFLNRMLYLSLAQ